MSVIPGGPIERDPVEAYRGLTIAHVRQLLDAAADGLRIGAYNTRIIEWLKGLDSADHRHCGKPPAPRPRPPGGAVTIERTAPRAVEDCPEPPGEDAWQSVDVYPARTFTTPAEALEWAGVLTSASERLREHAVLAMLRHGDPSADVAAANGLTVQHLHEIQDRIEHTRQRLAYSRAYYERHPGRIRDQWYAVEGGDPELPARGISVRERQA